jgi:hypothetical protein
VLRAQPAAATGVEATPQTYTRAESDRSFHNIARLAGGVKRFDHLIVKAGSADPFVAPKWDAKLLAALTGLVDGSCKLPEAKACKA